MNIVKCVIITLFAALSLHAQTGAPVDVNGFPSGISQPSKYFYYDGSSNMIYICYAHPQPPNNLNPGWNFSLSVGGGTLTSIAVSSNVGTVTTVSAHGLQVGQKVVVSNSTTTAINGTYWVQSVPSSTTFTITTSGVSNGTYNDTGMTLSGAVPLLTGAIWSIEKLTYNGSNQLIGIAWANGSPGQYTSICANAEITTGSTAIFYQ